MSEVRVSLVALELDALRETATIATARAANALGTFIAQRVWLAAPTLHWSPGPWADRTPGSCSEPLIAVSSTIHGALEGSIIFLASAATACEIAHLLAGGCDGGDPCDPLVRSCVTETSNILGGTYLTALAALTGGTFYVSAPTWSCLPETTFWQDLEKSGEWPAAGLCLETELNISGAAGGLPFRFYLLADSGAFAGVLASLKAWS